MFIDATQKDLSSFYSSEKDLERIVSKMLENNRLKKLLFYQGVDALEQSVLTQEQTLGLINTNIRLVPKLTIDLDCKTYVIVGFDHFVTNDSNPQFRNNVVTFDIICHFDNWNLGNFQLRPYKIMGEIDGMFNNKKLTGIGTLQFLSGEQLLLNDELGGFSLTYIAIHGEEDKEVGE